MPHSIFRWDSKDRLMIVASGRVACGTVLVVALLFVPSNCVSGEEVRCSFKPVSAGILFTIDEQIVSALMVTNQT